MTNESSIRSRRVVDFLPHASGTAYWYPQGLVKLVVFVKKRFAMKVVQRFSRQFLFNPKTRCLRSQ